MRGHENAARRAHHVHRALHRQDVAPLWLWTRDGFVHHIMAADTREFFEELSAAELRANKDAIDAGVLCASEFDLTRFCGPSAFTFNHSALVQAYWDAGQRLRERIGSVAEKIFECQRREQAVFGEFGQAYWLDKRHGFSPNVTASHT